MTRVYRCSKCRQHYKRDSAKAWIKSYCSKTDQYARLMLVKKLMEKSA